MLSVLHSALHRSLVGRIHCLFACFFTSSKSLLVCPLLPVLTSFWLHVYLVLILLICTIHVSKALELHTMHSYYLCTEWRMHQVHRIYGHFCISMLFYGNVIQFISHSFRLCFFRFLIQQTLSVCLWSQCTHFNMKINTHPIVHHQLKRNDFGRWKSVRHRRQRWLHCRCRSQ